MVRSFAGCGKGIMDLLLIIDGSENLSEYEFKEVNKWLGDLFVEIGRFFDTGSAWISIVVTGGDPLNCDPAVSKRVTTVRC